jgi:hypothetical protein
MTQGTLLLILFLPALGGMLAYYLLFELYDEWRNIK